MAAIWRWAKAHRVLVFIGLPTLLLIIGLHLQGQPLQTDAAPQGIVSLELARDAKRADGIIRSWRGSKENCCAFGFTARQTDSGILNCARTQVYLDFPFIVFYSVALFCFGRYARARALGQGLPVLAGCATVAACMGLLAGALDIIEDLGLLQLLNQPPDDWVAARTSLCAEVKFALIAASLGISIVTALSRPIPAGAPIHTISWRSMARVTRAVLWILLLTGLALLVPPQTADMLAILSQHDWRGRWSVFAFHLTLSLLAFSAWYWARALLAAHFGVSDAARAAAGGRDDALDWAPRGLFILVALIGAIAAIRSAAWWQLLIIAVWTLAFLYLLHLRLPLGWWSSLTPMPAGSGFRRLIEYAPGGPRVAISLLGIATLAFIAAALGTFFPEWLGFLGRVTARFGYAFPGPAAALLALALMLGPFAVLSAIVDRVDLGGSIHRLSWSMRPPILLFLLAVVLVVPSLINLHAVRTVTAGTVPVDSRNNVEELFKAWAQKCHPEQKNLQPVIVAVSGGASRAGLWAARVLDEVDSLVKAKTGIFAVSSVSGGSLGAAAYVATLAGQKLGPCSLDDRAAFAQAALKSQGDDALGPLLAGSLIGDIPRALLAVPAHIVRRAYYLGKKPYTLEDWRGGDRAESLELAFERNWARAIAEWKTTGNRPFEFSQPFLSLAYPEQEVTRATGRATPRGAPIWIANGTDAQNGERVLTAPFNYEAWPFLGALDALALLRRDVPISTAVHNTARFPFLSPAGELTPATSANDQTSRDQKWTYPTQLIDGGYFENEGLLTAWELARYLKDNAPRIMGGADYTIDPILVQATADADKDIAEERIIRCSSDEAVDTRTPDGAARSLGRSRPLQAAVPLAGLYSVRGGHSDWILREVRQEYCPAKSGDQAKRPQQFFHFYLYRLDEDVPLNWILSQQISGKIWNAMTDDVDRQRNCNIDESSALANLLKGQDQQPAAAPNGRCGKPPPEN